MRVTLIQCTKTKRSKPAQAKDLYDASGYFQDMRADAEAQDYPWFILSAKHGLVYPETEIEPYDERGLLEQQATEIATTLEGKGVDRVEIVAGKEYSNPLVPELEQRGIEVHNNLRGCRIGKRRQRLQEWTSVLRNEKLC